MSQRSLLDQFRVIRNTRSARINMVTSHYHDGYEIYYLINGNARYFLDNKVYDLAPGDIILIPPHTLHKTNVTSDFPAERLLINFTKEFLNRKENDALFSCFNSYCVNHPEKYINYITQIESEFAKQDVYTENVIKSLLIVLLSKLSRASDGKKPTASSSPLIEKVIKHINENFAEDITLQLLADRFSISRNYLSKRFKSETGFGINEYLNIIRIKSAEHLLTSSNMPMTEVAAQCGFNDSNYFSSVFKKVNGSAPLQYRKKNQSHE